MSYREGNEGYQGWSRSRQQLWPSIDSLPTAVEVARKAYGGWVFAVSLALGAIYVLVTNKNPVDQTTASSMALSVSGIVIELVFVLFASYRMTRGKGWLISWFLLAVFLLEVVGKILGGTFGVFWLVAYLYIAASILSGARACWAIRQRRRLGEHEESLGEVFA